MSEPLILFPRPGTVPPPPDLPPPRRRIDRLWRRLDGSIRARILIPTALLFTATIAAMAFAVIELYGRSMRQGQEERARLVADMVRGELSTTMLEAGHQYVPGMLMALAKKSPDVQTISLIRPVGDVAFSSEPALIGSRPWEDATRFEEPAIVPKPGVDEYEFAVVAPIPNGEACRSCHGSAATVNGYLDVRFSRRPVVLAKRRLARTLAVTATPALIVLLGIAWWLLRREVVKPLDRIVEAMRRAEKGAMVVHAHEGRPDELGQVARSFDATLAALRRAQREVDAYYRERMLHVDRFAAVGELATGLAHEIRNPLAGLSGALELLADDGRRSPEEAEVVAEMRHQVARLTRIMDGMLSFARPAKVRLRHTDVNDCLAKVVFLATQHCRSGSRSIRVVADAADVLPIALADPSQLEQVLLNIALNAIQAMNGAGGELTLRTVADLDDRVIIEIADSGPGIPEDVRPHIFKPFYTTKSNGTGLGLAISARIVAEHGGQLEYECPPSGGTIFRISLRTAASATGERAA